MSRNTLAALIAGLFTLPVQAQQTPLLDEIVVTATRIPTPDVIAPYASEVHTRRAIEQSGASTLYDYLARQTSVQVLPNFGNRFTPLVDMRGYGIGGGYQNIVVTLDGRRLNTIDSQPQLLGAIPLADIERIEITKGSGSVLFGDGATAGSIQIYTRPHQGVALAANAGNHGLLAGTATAGLNKEKFSLSASADYSSLDGYSAADVSGNKDASSSRAWRGSLVFLPFERVEIGMDAASARIDTRYIGPISLALFNANPAQNGGNTYTRQSLDSDQWVVRLKADLAPGLSLSAKHEREDKLSAFPPSAPANYDSDSNELGLRYSAGAVELVAGVQSFNGVRIGAADRTGKDNQGYYLQGQYRLRQTTFAAGARRENVEYSYSPSVGAALRAEHRLSAWDIGVNQRLDDSYTLFANFNRAFQAPDIDRFFLFGGAFNGFITPAISRTLNLGLNHVTPTNRLKLAVFRANLDHEIFLKPLTFVNTNLDQTHKYGLELQDTWRATETLTANLNYTWTRALIDRENDGAGAFNGKDLPGVPRHGVVLGLAWQTSARANLGLTHAWRSRAYAAEDFANAFSQKQAAYQSTDLALRYRLKDVEWFAAVDNLFERKNGLWIRDDAIYPVSFTRNWRLGMKAQF
jgi:iron complex outermembrane receptor protein